MLNLHLDELVEVSKKYEGIGKLMFVYFFLNFLPVILLICVYDFEIFENLDILKIIVLAVILSLIFISVAKIMNFKFRFNPGDAKNTSELISEISNEMQEYIDNNTDDFKIRMNKVNEYRKDIIALVIFNLIITCFISFFLEIFILAAIFFFNINITECVYLILFLIVIKWIIKEMYGAYKRRLLYKIQEITIINVEKNISYKHNISHSEFLNLKYGQVIEVINAKDNSGIKVKIMNIDHYDKTINVI